jgi:hypothetical protein
VKKEKIVLKVADRKLTQTDWELLGKAASAAILIYEQKMSKAKNKEEKAKHSESYAAYSCALVNLDQVVFAYQAKNYPKKKLAVDP